MAKPNAPTSARVEAALEEFDEVGQLAFLLKYEKGHEPNRWLLRVRGRFYPMKAIWVASHDPPADPSVMDYRNGIRDLRGLGYFDIVAIEEKDHRPPLATPTRPSVLAAMREYMRMGTEAFLDRYTEGHRPKSKYVLHEGTVYPLKALFAASNTPPIRHRHFGYRDAEAEMRALGFEVIVRRKPPEIVRPGEDNFDAVSEGLRIVRELNVIKRSRSIVEKVKSLKVPLACEVCGFDFEKRYGSLGRGFIEAHHVEPLSKREGINAPTTIEDFAMLCANCHRMIHHGGGSLTVEELRALLQPHVKD
ncbi:hypothetical protein AMC82_PB00111 (plasmid) [Rhizobium phaseoli]|uniref:HNH endonuclease n=1 Tax=Rhizobium phaseoli TaxID=396 RepID=UPI0007EB96B4|nr:HNH endonuclease [Rhizobium phaseoli]ANL68274.1 hypothetical protein AMC84_PB00111 [Rhizobium phaseoli]ANL81085.1 hypothetical protein AMC82_PB00111 [Rhizobium phaseoli]